MDVTAEAIYGLDATGRCIFANQACSHLLGYDHLDEGPQKARMRAREEAILGELGIGR